MSEETGQTNKTYLIYASGYPDEGQELTEEQLQAEVSAGRVQACDLVMADGVWRQLSDIFGMEPYALPDYTDASEGEIALLFKDLPPCQLKTEEEDAGPRHGFKGWLLQRRDGRRRPWWQFAVVAVAVVVVLAVLMVFWGIPLCNQMLWRPAYVLVMNPYNEAGKVLFDGEEYDMPARGSVTIADIFGRMPRTEQLVMKMPKENIPINVPLRAGESVLVNPTGRIFFGVVRTDVKSSGETEQRKRELVTQVFGGKEPTAALAVAEDAKKSGGEALLAFTDEGLVYSSEPWVTQQNFSFEQLGMKRSADDLEKRKQMVVPEGILTCNLLGGVKLRDYTVQYRKGTRQVAGCRFTVPAALVGKTVIEPVKLMEKRFPNNHFTKVPKNFYSDYTKIEPVGGEMNCEVRFEEKETVVRVTFSRRNFKLRRHQRDMQGTWVYEARRAVAGGKWNCIWRYDAWDKPGIAHLVLEVLADKVSIAKYEEKRGKAQPQPRPKGKK